MFVQEPYHADPTGHTRAPQDPCHADRSHPEDMIWFAHILYIGDLHAPTDLDREPGIYLICLMCSQGI